MVFRDAIYLNSLLVHSETWYFISKKNMEALNEADAKFFQVCFQSHSKTCRDAYYMETGKQKVMHIIAKRCLMFLFNILKRDNSQTLKKFYLVQRAWPTRNDWILQINNDKLKYDISMNDNEISQMSKSQFKKYTYKLIQRHKVNFVILTIQKYRK